MGHLVIFDGVWKQFVRGERHTSLRDLIPATARRLLGRGPAGGLGRGAFWALQDVSFRVGRGEALAIIGPNGAGKSTILKLLTRILKPSLGHAAVRGRAGALIEVAAGFHPDLTGRENIFLQGAIMGMKRAEIVRKFDEIVAFAGTAEALDTPVKRYSSGMNARLGFSIAAHLDPDVLIIDEILSVGDTAFQAKCLDRMKQLVARGVPLVFVSHNLPAVLQLCTRVIVLDRGRIVFDGDPAAGVREYQRVHWAPCLGEPAARADAEAPAIRITGARLLDARGCSRDVVRTNEPVTVRIEYLAERPVEDPHFWVEFVRGDGTSCTGIMDHRAIGTLRGKGSMDLVIPRLPLLAGCYLLHVAILDRACVHNHDFRDYVCPFSVTTDSLQRGLVYMDHHWHHAPDLNDRARRGFGEGGSTAAIRLVATG